MLYLVFGFKLLSSVFSLQTHISVPTFPKILNEVFGVWKMWMVCVIEEIVERSKCSVVASLCFFVYSAIPEHRC